MRRPRKSTTEEDRRRDVDVYSRRQTCHLWHRAAMHVYIIITVILLRQVRQQIRTHTHTQHAKHYNAKMLKHILQELSSS